MGKGIPKKMTPAALKARRKNAKKAIAKRWVKAAPIILALFLCGCQTRHGSETQAVERAIARNIAAIERSGKSVVAIEQHSANIAHATHDASSILRLVHDKDILILQYEKAHPKK